MDLKQHLIRQMAFSHATFGPGTRTKGVVDHISKELTEVLESGGSIDEWVDVVILALDGLTRAACYGKPGGEGDDVRWEPEEAAEFVIRRIKAKQSRNEARTWPDWRTMSADKAIEHDRTSGVQ